MACFVLIPGGWRGGWAFAGFVARLKRAGHEAYAVTLSGLDEVSDRPAAGVNLDTHISDVTELLTVEDLSEVILCAHSYGGMVATGVADRAPERVAALIYLDAFVPDHGQSWWDLAGERYRQIAIERSRHDGLTVLPPEGRDPRCRPHPLGSFLQALQLRRAAPTIPRVFIFASGLGSDAVYGAVSAAPGRSSLDRAQHRVQARRRQRRAGRCFQNPYGDCERFAISVTSHSCTNRLRTLQCRSRGFSS